MPNIATYESKSDLTPSDKGINAAADAARVYQYTANQIGHDISKGLHDIGDAVEKHQAVMETSELYKTGTDAERNAENLWQEWSAQPENRGTPHAGDRFMAEVVDPMLEQWGASVRTDHAKQIAVTLRANIRNKLFNKISADQADMEAAHVEDNHTSTRNNLGAGLITDPSGTNYRRTIGTMATANEAMTATISDVGMRERALTEYNKADFAALTVQRYEGVATSITNQIAETGGDTSPALEQLGKDIKEQLGFEYLSPAQQTAVTKIGEQAVSRGQELFNSRNATAKSKLIAEGNAAYAEIHHEITRLAIAGQGPTPELIESAQAFSRRYGATNAGQAASLDDFIMQGQDRAQRNTVQPFDQNVRDSIQTGFSLPKGDPRRPTLASLVQAYSHGQITDDDLKGYSEILNKLDKPTEDPSFAPAWQQFQRWQNTMVQSIGQTNSTQYPGTAAARAQFIHDSTANFMARGRTNGDWEKTLSLVTDPHNRGSFANIMGPYQRASQYPYAAKLLARDMPVWNPDNTLTWPSGNGGGRPATPAGPSAAPAKPVAPAADLQKADEILWGKK